MFVDISVDIKQSYLHLETIVNIVSIFSIYESITVVDMCCYFMSSTYTVIRQITELNPIDNIVSHYVCIYI